MCCTSGDAITQRPSFDVTGSPPILAYGAKWGQSAQSACKHTDKRSQQDAKLLVTSLHLPAPCSSPPRLQVSGVTLSQRVENGSISWMSGIALG